MTNALKEFYSKKSTEELEEILRLDVDYGGEHGLDADALSAILEVLQDRNYNEEHGVADRATWEDFEKYYLPGLEERVNNQETEEEDFSSGDVSDKDKPALVVSKFSPKKLNSILKAASIVLATVLVVGVVSTTASAMGYDIWGTVVSWTKDTLKFSFFGDGIPTVQGYEGEYKSLQEALEAHGVTEPLAPTWLPKGYALEDISISDVAEKTHFIGTYSNSFDERIAITVVRHKSASSSFWHEKDENEVVVYTVNNIDHYISSNYNALRTVWTNQNFEVWISGSMSQQEMQKTVESIYER